MTTESVTKVCSGCKDVLPLSAYERKRTRCRSCRNAQRNARCHKNRENYNAERRTYFHKNREQISARRRRHYANNSEKFKQKRAQFKDSVKAYNAKRIAVFCANGFKTCNQQRVTRLHLATASAIIEEQGGCAICGTHECAVNDRLCLDHDHATRLPRGFVCDRCNHALAAFDLDPTLCDRAADYLLRTLHKRYQWNVTFKMGLRHRHAVYQVRARANPLVQAWYAEKTGCEICGATEDEKRLHWDHDHRTQSHRGLLCAACNTALGSINERLALLPRIKRYLERTSAPAHQRALYKRLRAPYEALLADVKAAGGWQAAWEAANENTNCALALAA